MKKVQFQERIVPMLQKQKSMGCKFFFPSLKQPEEEAGVAKSAFGIVAGISMHVFIKCENPCGQLGIP